MKRMNQKIKTEWVALLEEGSLKQGGEQLYNKNTKAYCCLGVLCEMARAEGVVTRVGETYKSKKDGGDMCYDLLPDAVMDWSGISSCDPTPQRHKSSLSAMNDGGKTFKQIAKVIEKSM